MSLAKEGLEKGMKEVNEGLRGVQGPSTVTKLAPADHRYGSQIEITTFKLSRREVQGAT